MVGRAQLCFARCLVLPPFVANTSDSCCLLVLRDNDWLFKWIAVDSLAAQDGVEGASERRDDAGEEESEEMEGASPGKRQRRSAGGTAAGGQAWEGAGSAHPH